MLKSSEPSTAVPVVDDSSTQSERSESPPTSKCENSAERLPNGSGGGKFSEVIIGSSFIYGTSGLSLEMSWVTVLMARKSLKGC